MSSLFADRYLTTLVALLCLSAVGVFLWILYLRHWHVGYGMVLSWSDSKRAVVVRARLLDSPSHTWGVTRGMRLVSVGDIVFNSKCNFEMWRKDFKAERGKVTTFFFLDGKTSHPANLVAGLIASRVPVYKDLKERFPPVQPDKYCHKTGVGYLEKALKEGETEDCFFI